MIFVVNPDNNSLTAIAADSHEKVWERSTALDPRSVAIHGNELWVTSFDEGWVTIHRRSDGVELGRVQLGIGSLPVGIIIDEVRGKAWVAAQGLGQVIAIDVTSREIEQRIAVGPDPRELALNHDRSALYVTRYRSPDDGGQVHVIDPQTATLQQTDNPGN